MKHLLACAIAIACGVAAGIDTIDVFVPGEKGYVVSDHDPPTHTRRWRCCRWRPSRLSCRAAGAFMKAPRGTFIGPPGELLADGCFACS